jgi:hypothetical protein
MSERSERNDQPGSGMIDEAWERYVAAAQRLDAVRRGAAGAAAEHDRIVRAAREELTAVRARLAPQHARLRELGAAAEQLVPEPGELAAGADVVGGHPTAVLAALRSARATADAADAALLAGPEPAGATPPMLRNLLVYGPFAATVFLVQLALYVAADGSSLPAYAALCGLVMPAAAFGLGWFVVGLVFPAGPTGRVDRTPVFGAVTCLAPVLLTCVGVGVLAVLR